MVSHMISLSQCCCCQTWRQTIGTKHWSKFRTRHQKMTAVNKVRSMYCMRLFSGMTHWARWATDTHYKYSWTYCDTKLASCLTSLADSHLDCQHQQPSTKGDAAVSRTAWFQQAQCHWTACTFSDSVSSLAAGFPEVWLKMPRQVLCVTCLPIQEK